MLEFGKWLISRLLSHKYDKLLTKQNIIITNGGEDL